MEEIEGQYIGLMKFQNNGLDLLKLHYERLKEESKSGKNPLNSKLPFEKSFMTDLLQALINVGCKLKSIPIRNGWLELDTIRDYDIYNKMYKTGEISKFFMIKK